MVHRARRSGVLKPPHYQADEVGAEIWVVFLCLLSGTKKKVSPRRGLRL